MLKAVYSELHQKQPPDSVGYTALSLFLSSTVESRNITSVTQNSPPALTTTDLATMGAPLPCSGIVSINHYLDVQLGVSLEYDNHSKLLYKIIIAPITMVSTRFLSGDAYPSTNHY